VSLEAVQRVIGRAVTDSAFRGALQADPDGILGSRDLTGDEVAAIKAMDWSAVASVGNDLEQRVSRFGITRAAAGCK
jgi:hypothetical protein